MSSIKSRVVSSRFAQKLFHWDRNFLLRQVPAGGICAEIGVWKGDFSKSILEIARPKKLHLIDPWKFEASDDYADSLYGRNAVDGQSEMDATFEGVRQRFDGEIRQGVVEIHRATSDDAAREFPDASLDWVYIDGNHLYEHVRADLETYLPKVRPGGYLAGDDYGVEGWWHGGVTRAVDEFVASKKVRSVVIKNQQFLLQRES